MEGPALAEDLVLHEGSELGDLARPLDQAAVEVNWVYSINIVIGTLVVVSALDGGFNGKLGVFGCVMSIATL